MQFFVCLANVGLQRLVLDPSVGSTDPAGYGWRSLRDSCIVNIAQGTMHVARLQRRRARLKFADKVDYFEYNNSKQCLHLTGSNNLHVSKQLQLASILLLC